MCIEYVIKLLFCNYIMYVVGAQKRTSAIQNYHAKIEACEYMVHIKRS